MRTTIYRTRYPHAAVFCSRLDRAKPGFGHTVVERDEGGRSLEWLLVLAVALGWVYFQGCC